MALRYHIETPGTKVFCFFSSEKKTLLPFSMCRGPNRFVLKQFDAQTEPRDA
jgi:hypothetical protein